MEINGLKKRVELSHKNGIIKTGKGKVVEETIGGGGRTTEVEEKTGDMSKGVRR